MIGAGIFLLPAQVAKLLGPAALSGYLAAALAACMIALCFAEVGALFDRSGGPYIYARAAFGDFVGFEIGWMLLLARLTSLAAISNGFASYLGYFWPWAAAGTGRAIVILTAIALLAGINYRGVAYGARMVNVLTVGKLAPLLIFVCTGLFFLNPNREPAWSIPPDAALRQAGLLLIFALSGFEFAVVPGEEVLRPRRNVPIALLTAVATVATLYMLIQYVTQSTLPELAGASTPLAMSARRFLGPAGGVLLTIGAILSTTGTNSALMLVTPRVLFAMSEGGQLPRIFSRVHPVFRTPTAAIVATAILGGGLAMYSGFASLVAISSISRLLTYIATSAALPVLRRKMPDAQRWFSVPGGPIIPVCAVALSIWLLTGSTRNQIMISSGALFAGAVVYTWGRRFRLPSEL